MQRFRDLPKAQNNDYYKSIVDKMETPDNYTFRVTTKKPWAESLRELAGVQHVILPHEAVEKFGDLSTQAIGSGPFMLKEYVKGERTNLVRNPDYFDKTKPYLDGINWQTILDFSTLLQAYKSGQIDIGSGPYEGLLSNLTKLDYDDLKKNDQMSNLKIDWLSYGCLGVNASVKPFDDPRVRQALWCGMDRKQFIDKLGLGEGTPQGVLASGLSYWTLSQDELKPYIGYDPKKAKDLLNAAGYPNGFDFEADTSNGVPSYVDHAELMIAELKKIGINMSIKIGDLSAFLSDKLFTGKFYAVVFTH
jgi:ABC-type transport system substrate-binding protein